MARYLSSVLSGVVPAWPQNDPQGWEQAFWKAGVYHGVLPLIWERVRESPAHDWPSDPVARLATLVRRQAVLELAQRAEMLRVLKALAERGVRPLILKGTALGYSLYPAPYLRPRGDVDLLVAEDARAAVREVLGSMGYIRPNQISGSLVSTQSSFHRTDSSGLAFALDVHWRSSNSPLLSGVVEYTSARERAVPVAAMGVDALGLSAVDALLFACTHRAGHMQAPFYVGDEGVYGGDRLIWLYDIHLLCQVLTEGEWKEFVSRAARHRVRAICRDGLRAAQDAFKTPMPEGPLVELASATESEPSSVLLRGHRLVVMWNELKVLPSWRLRVLLLREHALPDAEYMLQKYGRQSRWWLPWLYLQRAMGGLVKLVGGPGFRSAYESRFSSTE